MLTVRELFDWDNEAHGELCVDVCDDYDERCYIAFISGCGLTEAGEERFKDALDVEVIPYGDGTWALHTDSAIEAEACRELFFAAAGFCGDSDFDEWFIER